MNNIKSISDELDNLIGGVPVSEQLGAALDRMASKNHVHDNYATKEEIENLKKKIDMLIGLVGDSPVSEQIYTAISSTK